MKDQKSLIDARIAVPVTVGKASVEGNAIDRTGFEAVTIAAVIGAGAYAADKTVRTVLLESEDGIAFTEVPANKVVGDPVVADAVLGNDLVVTLGYIGDAKYTRLDYEVEGVLAADVTLYAMAVLGHPALSPVA
ncbi:MAG: hypothetical protein CVV46_06115 [Spirochaetae bacterium HGW-Spirochaetae-2]|jgi:hypothetical protein|nr:MAG: hypothetical protein CVV46_06115 [Spirochaetae bacterium HGW-Spirochaetae-2]